MIKDPTCQENRTISNVHVPNNRASTYMMIKLKELKGERHIPSQLGDLNTILLLREQTENQSGYKRTKHHQPNRSNIYRTLHPTTTEYTFFLSMQNIPQTSDQQTSCKRSRTHSRD